MSLNRKQQKHLRYRIRRVAARLDRLQDHYEAIQDIDANDLRGPLKMMVGMLLDKFPEIVDKDEDGKIEFDELVAAVHDALDKKIDWVLDEKVEKELGEKLGKLSDAVLAGLAAGAVHIYMNTEERLTRRIARNKQLLTDLKAQLKEG